MPRWCFEDFIPGDVAVGTPRAISRDEIIAFATDFDPQPFHLDDEAAKASMLGGLAASGWHSCAFAMRMMCDDFIHDSTSLGSPGVEEVRWLLPLRPDQTLRLRRTVLEARGSASRPQMGIVRFRFELLTEAGDVAMSMISSIMFGRRAATEVAP